MIRFYISALSLLFAFGCVSQNKTAEGMRYYGQSQYDAALSSFQSALTANPEDPGVIYNVAAAYHQSAKTALRSGQAATAQQYYEQAAQHYQRCLSKNANFADAYRGLAALYMDCQNGEAAYTLLSNWNNANPASSEPKLELARYYQEFAQICAIQGRTPESQRCRSAAEKLLQQILALEPANYRALRASGFLKEQSGDIAGAVADYQRSLQSYASQKDLQDRIAALTR